MDIQLTIKAAIRDIVASVLSLSSVTSFSRFPASSMTILTFHRVLPAELKAEYPLRGLVVTPKELQWVLSVVQPYFDIRTLSEAYELTHRKNQQKPLLAITFDDGQWDNLKYGVPVLRALNVPATFYIPTAYIGSSKVLWHDEAGFAWQQLAENRKKIFSDISPVTLPAQVFDSARGFLQFLKSVSALQRNEFVAQLKHYQIRYPDWSRLMNWSEINQLIEEGHEIGSHARTHNLLSHQSLIEQREELNLSMEEIKTFTGVCPTSFCYPDGDYDEQTLNLLKGSQYKTAVTTQWGINRVISDKFKLRRCDIDSQYLRDSRGALSMSRFQFRLSSYQPGL